MKFPINYPHGFMPSARWDISIAVHYARLGMFDHATSRPVEVMLTSAKWSAL